jgi:hypothetical protein
MLMLKPWFTDLFCICRLQEPALVVVLNGPGRRERLMGMMM